jgi:hypothetical protein
MVRASVANKVNPNDDPTVEGSKPIFNTHPELITLFDETAVTLDNTDGDEQIKNRHRRDCIINDDGECVVTKSNSCTTAVRGSLDNGEALHGYIVLGSDKTSHHSCVPHIDYNLNDKAGHLIPLRYASNDKGNLNEEGALDNLKAALHPALGSLPPRSATHGKQADVICD